MPAGELMPLGSAHWPGAFQPRPHGIAQDLSSKTSLNTWTFRPIVDFALDFLYARRSTMLTWPPGELDLYPATNFIGSIGRRRYMDQLMRRKESGFLELIRGKCAVSATSIADDT